MSDLENETITKQRQEIYLLIGELKDRDRELNEMVAAHQQQLTAWKKDRRKMFELEQKNDKFNVEIRKRNEQLRLLIQRLKISELKHKNKDSALGKSENKLKQAEQHISETSLIKDDLQDKNNSLNTSITELTNKVTCLETKEIEMTTQLQLKEGDLVDAEAEISELKSKFRRMEIDLNQIKKENSVALVNLQQQKFNYNQCKLELENNIAEMATKTANVIELRQDVAKTRDDCQNLKRSLYMSEEDLKRKEELLVLQKSKEERTDMELTSLRQLYDRQQEELSVLQQTLNSSQEMLYKQEERLNNIGDHNYDFDGLDCSSQTTNELLEEARRSAEEDPALFLSDLTTDISPSKYEPRNRYSSTSRKLQQLMSESREMVLNLEKSA